MEGERFDFIKSSHLTKPDLYNQDGYFHLQLYKIVRYIILIVTNKKNETESKSISTVPDAVCRRRAERVGTIQHLHLKIRKRST